MGIAKKGTRLIVVGGHRLRWVVAPGDEPGLAIVVEHADEPGQRLVTWVDHGTVIAPGLVAEVVRDALGQGWTPRERGRQLTLRVTEPGGPARPWPPATGRA
jgi:hypothetical protein